MYSPYKANICVVADMYIVQYCRQLTIYLNITANNAILCRAIASTINLSIKQTISKVIKNVKKSLSVHTLITNNITNAKDRYTAITLRGDVCDNFLRSATFGYEYIGRLSGIRRMSTRLIKHPRKS